MRLSHVYRELHEGEAVRVGCYPVFHFNSKATFSLTYQEAQLVNMKFTPGSEPTPAATKLVGFLQITSNRTSRAKHQGEIECILRRKTLTKIRSFMKILNNVNIAGFRQFNKMLTNLRQIKKKIQAKHCLTQFSSPKQAVIVLLDQRWEGNKKCLIK